LIMKNKNKFILIALLIVALASVASTSPNIDCSYSNYNGSFTFEEMNFKERNFDMCLRKFEEFKKQNKQDTILYRLCKKNLFKFWNWGKYFSQKKFKLPYIAWQKINLRRGVLTAKSGFQDF
jgi:hypothetical protein